MGSLNPGFSRNYCSKHNVTLSRIYAGHLWLCGWSVWWGFVFLSNAGTSTKRGAFLNLLLKVVNSLEVSVLL